MAIELHPKCKTRLIDVLSDGLPKIQVKNGMFIDRQSVMQHIAFADSVLPKTGKVRDELNEHFEYPLTEFTLETLEKELSSGKFDGNRPPASLSEIDGYGDAKVVAARLIDSFQTLPWQYKLTFALPDEVKALLGPNQNEFRLATNMRLVRPNKVFSEQFPLDIGDTIRNRRLNLASLLLSPPQSHEWKADAVYLQIRADGFIGQYGGSQTAVKAERLVRALGGLGIALRLFVHKHKYVHGTPQKAYYHVHRKDTDGKWELANTLDVDDATDRGVLGLELSDVDGALKTEEQKAMWIVARLHDIASAFSAGPKAEPLLLASQWFFDSHASRDELLSFVQAMIVLEILLGDKDISQEIGLGELLRNRLAYMIGASHGDRTSLLEDFNEIYRVRSQIVHSGKHRLTMSERTLFFKLRWMCRRVMAKEVELLKADRQ